MPSPALHTPYSVQYIQKLIQNITTMLTDLSDEIIYFIVKEIELPGCLLPSIVLSPTPNPFLPGYS